MPRPAARSRRFLRASEFALLLCHLAVCLYGLHAIRPTPVVAQGGPSDSSALALPARAGTSPPPLRRRAYWGASIAAPADTLGATVRSVVAGSPAARAGLRVGDRLVRVNGAAVTSQ